MFLGVAYLKRKKINLYCLNILYKNINILFLIYNCFTFSLVVVILSAENKKNKGREEICSNVVWMYKYIKIVLC